MNAEKRKNFIDKVVSFVNDIDTTGKNGTIARSLLEGMNDTDFWDYVKKINSGEETLSMYLPNHGTVLQHKDLIKVSEKYKIPFWHHVIHYDKETQLSYRSIEKHLVLKVPVRRMIQVLDNKISIPENNKFVDNLTGQPAGPSAAAKISFQELMAMYNQGLTQYSITELIKYRGGDTKGFNAMNRALIENGQVSLDGIMLESGEVKAKATAGAYLTAQHYDNNL